jgi:hypothetical protein
MSRRASARTRTILPDPRFNSLLLAKFVNMVMERGKKSVAEKIVYGAVDRITEKTGKPSEQSIEVLSAALDNVKPTVEVKSRRVGGATYQVPVAAKHWQCVGSSKPHRRAPRSPWRNAWPPSCSTHPRTEVPRCVSAKTRIVWPRQTAPLHTTAGNEGCAANEIALRRQETPQWHVRHP